MKFVLLILLSYFVVSCGGYGVSPVAAPMVSYSQALGRDGSIRKAKSVQRKLIKNGLITLECVDVKKAMREAESVLKMNDGFVENKNEGEEVTLTARVPEEKLVVSLDGLAELGRVVTRRIYTRDMTVEYIDVDVKVRNLRVLRERLRKLYAKAGKVDEMLKIEKELSRVQAELDSLECRMKAMKKNIAYSSLSISIKRKRVPGPVGAVGKSIG